MGTLSGGDRAVARFAGWMAVVAAAAIGVAACSAPAGDPEPSPSPAPPSSPSEAPSDSVFARYHAQARAGDASENQIAALEAAVESGVLSYGDIDRLLNEAITCLVEAGVSYDRGADWERAPGFFVPVFGYGEPFEVGETCVNRHFQYAFSAYQEQPVYHEALDAALEAEREQVVECLRANDVVIDDDATLDELRQASQDLMAGSEPPVVCTTYWG